MTALAVSITPWSREQRYAAATIGVSTLGATAAVAMALIDGVTHLDVGLLVAMYLLTGIGVEVGMHRFFSHKAFKAGRLLSTFLGVSGSMAAQGPILFWVATHRRHHAFTDQPGDPHSPHLSGPGPRGWWRGVFHSHIGWMFAPTPANQRQLVADLLRDRRLLNLHKRYLTWVLLGLALPAALGACIGGSARDALGGLLWGGLLRIFLVNQATWAINSLAHHFGRRVHATRDQSRNLAWLAVFTLGGGWHNNHHAFPGCAHSGRCWWQFDPSGWFIELMALLGLAHDVRRAGTIEARR